MRWKISLAIAATSLILGGTVAAQTPGSGTRPGGTTTPAQPGTMTPGTPGSTTPSTPGSTTPGLSQPGVNDPSRGLMPPCPPGQARRPGSSICMPTTPGSPPRPPTTR